MCAARRRSPAFRRSVPVVAHLCATPSPMPGAQELAVCGPGPSVEPCQGRRARNDLLLRARRQACRGPAGTCITRALVEAGTLKLAHQCQPDRSMFRDLARRTAGLEVAQRPGRWPGP